MKSNIIFVHSELTPSCVPKLALRFFSSTSLASSQPPCHTLSFGSFHLSFFTPKSSKFLSSHFKNPNPKLQGGVKTRLSAHLGAMGVQENLGKMKWSSGGESRYPKIETLTIKCVLNSQIRVQDSSINKK